MWRIIGVSKNVPNVSRIAGLARSERRGDVQRVIRLYTNRSLNRGIHCSARCFQTRSSQDPRQGTQIEQKSSDQSHQNQQKPQTSNWRILFRFLGFVTWLPAVYLFAENVGTLGAIDGQSMSPTLNPKPRDKDIVLLNKYSAQQLNYRIGDVVMLYSPVDPNMIICKRILALPGDIVSVQSTNKQDGENKRIRIRIPPAHVWIEGDSSVMDARASAANHGHGFIRPSSRDSREYGPVPMGLIFARLDLILFPFSRFGYMPPRPNMKNIHSLHKFRERKTKLSPHAEDSPLSPYSIDEEWEWSTDSHGKKVLKGYEERDSMKSKGDLIEEEELRQSLEEKRRVRSAKREENQKSAQKFWNQLSRGGRLGDDAVE